jgi:hypothetical protein
MRAKVIKAVLPGSALQNNEVISAIAVVLNLMQSEEVCNGSFFVLLHVMTCSHHGCTGGPAGSSHWAAQCLEWYHLMWSKCHLLHIIQ